MLYTMDAMPEQIQGMPKKAQEMWIAAYNRASEDGKSEEDCAKMAWGAVKRDYEQDADGKWHKKTAQAASPVTRGELIALAQSKSNGNTRTIQILRAGDFVDMHGKPVAVTADDLETYVANSNALLAGTEVPVEIGHPEDEAAPAAAWYRRFFKQVVEGVEWVCAEIELSALGTQALTDQLYKYFSANLSLGDKTVVGGGFVNRPAVSGQQPVGSLSGYLQPRDAAPSQSSGGRMDKPKSLFGRIRDAISQVLNVAELEMSQEDLRDKIYKALKAKYADPMDDWGMALPYIVQTYDNRVVVCKRDQYFQIPYTLNAQSEVELGEPVEGDVSLTFTPKPGAASGDSAAMSTPSSRAVEPAAPTPAAGDVTSAPTQATLSGDTAPSTTAVPSSMANPPEGGESHMGDQNNGTPAAPAATPPAANPLPVTVPDPNLTPEQQLAKAQQEAQLAAQKQLQEFEAQLAAAREQAWKDAQAQMARKQSVANLSVKLTTGRLQFPYTAVELEQVLIQLSDADRAVIAPILEKVHDNGLVELGEHGSALPGQGVNVLPAYAKDLLKAWLAKGDSVEAFFAANPELGSSQLYNLSEFQPKK